VKTKGSVFDLAYRRVVPRLGHAQAIGAISHRLCRLIWIILHQGVRYEERGPAVSRARAPAACRQNDPPAPKPWVSRRTRTFPNGQSSMTERDFRPWQFWRRSPSTDFGIKLLPASKIAHFQTISVGLTLIQFWLPAGSSPLAVVGAKSRLYI
jgi:hypothetical protein